MNPKSSQNPSKNGPWEVPGSSPGGPRGLSGAGRGWFGPLLQVASENAFFFETRIFPFFLRKPILGLPGGPRGAGKFTKIDEKSIFGEKNSIFQKWKSDF